jgi:predicted transcriptional regulator of viral defense system
MTDTTLTYDDCLEGPEGCSGTVEYRTTPDRSDFKAFPRCERHFEKRLESAERTQELLSATPPSWFDPTFAGERWDEDY